MKHSIRRIGLLLLLIVVLPSLIYTAVQFSRLSEGEKAIEDIYANQLDAILFSVNQYSDDVLNSVTGRINELIVSTGESSFEKKLIALLSERRYIRGVLFFSQASGKKLFFTADSSFILPDSTASSIASRDSVLTRLRTFQRGGYRQVQPLQDLTVDGASPLLFCPDSSFKDMDFCALFVMPEFFFRDILAPRIQSIAQNKFVISVFNSEDRSVYYSTESTPIEDIRQVKGIWLFPGSSLGIKLKGETISSLAQDRSRLNVYLFLLLNIFVLAGVYLLYRSIRREVVLAQMKSEFVANVSHELRTPLALISMFAETLSLDRVRSEEKKNEYYDIIFRETARLSRIVNKILNFSRGEAGKRKYVFGDVDLQDIITSTLSMYRFHLENEGFTLTVSMPETVPFIHADKEAVTEAFINLLDNAKKYSSENKLISVDVRQEGNVAVVSVSDKGIGISKEHTKKIFEKFYRVGSGDVHNVKGAGLGLALVSQIMKAHGGSVTVTSTLGAGSTFTLQFPIAKNNLQITES